MQTEMQSMKKHVYRATGIAFLIQLFGALGAGFIFVVGNILKVDILGASSEFMWHIFFWATDFFFVGFTVVLSYIIAGLPAVAPALTLGVYFSHFAGLYAGGSFSVPLYSAFFASPNGGAGGVNIGYMGYLLMALMLGYLIKYLYRAWNAIKNSLGPKLDGFLAKLAKKIKPLAGTTGIMLLEAIDLIVLVLILPVVSAVVTFLVINYGVAIPFNLLGEALKPVLVSAYESSGALGGMLMGAMVGFDTIGPVSRAAFSVAADAAVSGNTALVTNFGLCFAVTGWVPFAAWLMNKVFKKGGNFNTDDGNLAMSGPINAFFDNMKLTVAFGNTYAYRDPFKVIPCYMLSCTITGLLAGAVNLASSLYLEAEKIALFQSGDWYTSFLQPLRSISSTPKGVLLPVFAAIGALAGAAVLIVLKQITYKRQLAKGTYEQIDGDIVLEMREWAKRDSK